MKTRIIAGRPLAAWVEQFPQLTPVIEARETLWINPRLADPAGRNIAGSLGLADIEEADARLRRFSSYLVRAFPETGAAGGLIESALIPAPTMKRRLDDVFQNCLPGGLYVKDDGHLPIAGSVKARGGIYEVLKTAEEIVVKTMGPVDDYARFDDAPVRALLARYTMVVGSTGNLGLSIGIMSARLGFKVVVHMSAEAKQWKKDLLRAKGAAVVEHAGDYGQAVAQGRREAESDPKGHFVDDENSLDLFLGYATAALRLRRQLADQKIAVDIDHPLLVYIPCGVGGAPGGVAFGLRTVFGSAVHCFFAEPTHSPAMLLGLLTGLHNQVSVNDFGLDNVTEADGLAVGRPSGLVGKMLEKDISGVFTVADHHLYRMLADLADAEGIFLEPSAMAGFPGPWQLSGAESGSAHLDRWGLRARLSRATHIIWGTGGGLVPPEIQQSFYQRGRATAWHVSA